MVAPLRSGGSAGKRVLAAVPDLFFGSKLSAPAARLGIAVQFAATRDALLEGARCGPDLIVADLDAATIDAVGVALELKAGKQTALPRMIAFASHVHGERLEAARQAGFDEVLTKGALAARIPEILGSLARSDGRLEPSVRSPRG